MPLLRVLQASVKAKGHEQQPADRKKAVTQMIHRIQFPSRFEVGGRVYRPVRFGDAIGANRLVKDLYDFV